MAWEDRDYYRDESRGGGTFRSRMVGSSIVVWLLAINFVVFVLDFILSQGMRSPWWLSPMYWCSFTVDGAIYHLQIWRFLTFQFLHGGFIHLLFNMIGLFFFGPMIEQWWGSKRFLAFYLLCGVSGAVLYTMIVLLAPSIIVDVDALSRSGAAPSAIPLVGASGGIFGILVACAVLYPTQRVMLLFPPIPMSMRTMALLFLGIAVLTLIFGSPNAGGQAAHLGGAVLGFFLVKNPRLLDWADRFSRFSPASIQAGINKGRFERQQQRQRQQQDEVDRILEKVKDKGLQSLTRKEKKVLSQATDRQRRVG